MTAPPRPETDTLAHPAAPERERGIEGLWAAALLLVLGYHAEVPFMGGGHVGVDVALVAIGFTATRRLLQDSFDRQRVGIADFWATQARWLLPTLALVVLAGLAASRAVLPGHLLDDAAGDAIAAALQVANLHVADTVPDDGTAVAVGERPALHLWAVSLAIQVLLLWPILVAAACWTRRVRTFRRSRGHRRRALTVVLAAVAVASLAAAVTEHGGNAAFFGLGSRLWQVAVGGLLAVLPAPSLLRRVRRRTVAGVAGLLLLAGSAVALDDVTRYPGATALVPVAGAGLLLVAGETWAGMRKPSPVGTVLESGPVRWLARTAYAWYLWHWVAIVLAVDALEDGLAVRMAAVVAALPVAVVTRRWVQQPVARSRALRPYPGVTLGVVVCLSVIVVAVAVLVRPEAPVLAPPAPIDLTDLEAPADAPIEERVGRVVAVHEEGQDGVCPTEEERTDDGDRYCVLGDPRGTTTVLVVGDSRVTPWRRSLDAIGKTNRIAFAVRQVSPCPPFRVDTDAPDRNRNCRGFQEGHIRTLDRLEPDAVIVVASSGLGHRLSTQADGSDAPLDEHAQVELWATRSEAFYRAVEASGSALGVVLDAPTMPANTRDCLLAEGGEADACAAPRAQAFARSGHLLDATRRVLQDLDGVEVLDAGSLVCDDDRCHVEVDGTIAYVDGQHLTDALVARHLDVVERFVAALVG